MYAMHSKVFLLLSVSCECNIMSNLLMHYLQPIRIGYHAMGRGSQLIGHIQVCCKFPNTWRHWKPHYHRRVCSYNPEININNKLKDAKGPTNSTQTATESGRNSGTIAAITYRHSTTTRMSDRSCFFHPQRYILYV